MLNLKPKLSERKKNRENEKKKNYNKRRATDGGRFTTIAVKEVMQKFEKQFRRRTTKRVELIGLDTRNAFGMILWIRTKRTVWEQTTKLSVAIQPLKISVEPGSQCS
jgi:hypothetical protein